MIKSITSNITKNILKIFILILILLIIIIFFLARGVSLEKLTLPNAQLSGLYIKLDKKLIVEIDEIDVFKPTKDIQMSSDSLSTLDVVLNRIPIYYFIFEAIEIKKIKYEDKIGSISYKDKNLFLDTKHLTMNAKSISYDDGSVSLELNELSLKDYHLILNGLLQGNIKESTYVFDGSYDIYDIYGEMKLNFSDNILSYNISSDDFNYNLFKNLMDTLFGYVKLDEEAQSWIYRYVKADTYKIISFDGKVDTEKLDFYPEQIKGTAIAKNINVTFNENLSSAKAKEAHITFENDELVFFTKNVTYENMKLDDSNVTISNLVGNDDLIVKVYLSTNELFNDKIYKIIKAYDLEVPVRQLSGKNSAKLNIYVTPEPFNVDLIGDFSVEDSKLTISDIPFYTKYAKIKLTNSFLEFYNSNIGIDNIFDIDANASFYASEGILEANTTVNNFSIKADDYVVAEIENIDTNVLMFLLNDGGVKFEIDEYDVNLTFSNKSVFDFGSLENIYQFIPFAVEHDIKNGYANISTEDFVNFYGIANISNVQNIPLKYQNKTIDNFNGEFFITESGLNIKSFNNFFDVGISNEINISIQDVDLVITDAMIKDAQEAEEISGKSTPINFSSKNATIIVEPLNITIKSNALDVKIDEDKNITANFYENSGNIEVTKNNEAFLVYANNFTSSFINNVINNDFFIDGTFNTYIEGDSTNEFDGIFVFNDTALREFALISNIVSFINTIPALATLNNPKFSTTGYPIKEGVIEFSRMNDFIYIPNLFLEGYTTDVNGMGYVELDTKEIYMDIEISTLKSLSSIIDYIPLLNFIILGEDGKITISLAVRGTYDNPIVQTNMAEGAIKSPFNLIKRIFQAPFKLFQ